MTARLLAALLALGLAAPARAYLLIDGPMPLLGAQKPAPAGAKPGYTPAPRPNPDIDVSVRRSATGAAIKPGLIDRSATPAGNAAGGAAFSEQLERRSRPVSNFGSTLAPAIVITQPID